MTDKMAQSALEARAAGTLADWVRPGGAPEDRPSFARATWIKIAILGGLFVAVNYWQFQYLVKKWLHDPNWSHGFLIPLFSLYLLYVRRDELLAARRRVSLWGLGILILGILLTVYIFAGIGTYWLCQLSMILSLLGLVLYLGGWRLLRVTWVPIVYLALAMPIPDIVYAPIAVRLQGIAAASSGALLRLFGAEVQVIALNLRITSVTGVPHALTVAEACSGMRSLMAFVALSVAMAYIEDHPLWQRLVLILAGLPIAVACNILRVTLTTTMYVLDKPELGQDFMHKFMGMALLIPALLLLLLLNRLMRTVYQDADDEGDPEPGDSSATPASEGGARA